MYVVGMDDLELVEFVEDTSRLFYSMPPAVSICAYWFGLGKKEYSLEYKLQQIEL